MTTTKTAPLYVQFAQALHAKCQELGLQPTRYETPTGFFENANFFFVEFGPHLQAPALIVPKSATRMGRCDLHIDCSDLPGWIPATKKNGKVVGHFAPDLDLLTPVLKRLPGGAKRATQAPVATPVKAPVDTKAGEEELKSWAPDEETEGEFSTQAVGQ